MSDEKWHDEYDEDCSGDHPVDINGNMPTAAYLNRLEALAGLAGEGVGAAKAMVAWVTNGGTLPDNEHLWDENEWQAWCNDYDALTQDAAPAGPRAANTEGEGT